MKSSAGYDQPRRKAASGKKQIRLDLRPTKRKPSPEEEIERSQQSQFWKWFALVALFHFFLIVGVLLFYRLRPSPPPPEPFISLMPEGDIVKGTPGAQAAPKLGATTAAPEIHHTKPKPAPTPPPLAEKPPPPQAAVPPIPPQPVVHSIIQPDAPAVAENKPKPTPPKPKKVKVDLHLVDRTVSETEEPAPKPKHVKKAPPQPVLGDDEEIAKAAASPENKGLSREQIAAKLGAKLDAAGTEHASKFGPSGSSDSHPNPFADFYASIQEQTMDKWQEPNQDDAQATNPVVQIHVEKDGRVPPERVTLVTSSGNQAIDDSALAAARSLGYTLEPLPDGCPPDISINFQLTH
jgi:TonB family protein